MRQTITTKLATSPAGTSTSKKGGRFEDEMSGGTIAGRDQHITYGLITEEVAALVIELKRVG